MDKYQQYDIARISSELEQGQNEMQALWICWWICLGMVIVEFIFWIVYGVNSCMERVRKDALTKNYKLSDADE